MGLPASSRELPKQDDNSAFVDSNPYLILIVIDLCYLVALSKNVSLLNQIKTLSSTEAVMAMEALWERLCSGEDEPESPDWHQQELEKRDQMIQTGEATFAPWDEAK